MHRDCPGLLSFRRSAEPPPVEQLTCDRATYVASLKAVITDLALADNVVIVGHGVGLLLADIEQALLADDSAGCGKLLPLVRSGLACAERGH